MDLMNKDFAHLRRDLTTETISTFRQDPKLVAAIDKLFYRNIAQNGDVGKDGPVILPERKLKFEEVQSILQQGSKVTTPLLPTTNERRKAITKKIEDLLININKTADTGDTPKLIIRNQRLWSNCFYDLDRLVKMFMSGWYYSVTLKTFNDAKKTTICYSSKEDKNRFNIIIFVLTKIQELLSKNLTVTRRELFYQNISRLSNQSNLDMAVRDVCCLLESPPWYLGILATAKGLIAGTLTMHYANGNILDCTASGGVLVPQDIEGIKEFRSTAKYILVVEKDAIFQKLFDERILIRLKPVIMITGKGYPDVCTRQLLCRLCNELKLKALALVDADPHGYEIFLTYKYGSLAQSHLASSLACSNLALLGARFQDITTLAPTEARLRLTELDKRKLASLLKRPYLNSVSGSRIKLELNSMLSSGVKAEIEALAPTATALCDAYLPAKIIQGDFLG